MSSSVQWTDPPPRRCPPDFDNLLSVLRREVPARPTLFEFLLNERLYERLSADAARGTSLDGAERIAWAYYRAGYDFAPFFSGLSFPSARTQHGRTVSLNEGALIVDRASFRDYAWPDPDALDWSALDRLAVSIPRGMKLIGYCPDGVLENVIKLLGYEQLCTLLWEDESLVHDTFDAVGACLLRFQRRLLAHPIIGACMMNDDWGFRTQTMLSPKDLRRFVFGWHKAVVDHAHSLNKPAILHSCGHFERIVPDILEIGFQARHSYEDAILPVEEAYERYGSQFAILGGLDVDFVARSTPEQVYERARAMLERTKTRGGYALGTGNSVPDYIPDENYFAMLWAAQSD